jgi:hypothetical protein
MSRQQLQLHWVWSCLRCRPSWLASSSSSRLASHSSAAGQTHHQQVQQQQQVQHMRAVVAVVEQTMRMLLVLQAVATIVASQHAAANAEAAAEVLQGMLLGCSLHVAVRVWQWQKQLQQGWPPALTGKQVLTRCSGCRVFSNSSSSRLLLMSVEI